MMYSPTVLPSSRFAPNQAVGKKLEVCPRRTWNRVSLLTAAFVALGRVFPR